MQDLYNWLIRINVVEAIFYYAASVNNAKQNVSEDSGGKQKEAKLKQEVTSRHDASSAHAARAISFACKTVFTRFGEHTCGWSYRARRIYFVPRDRFYREKCPRFPRRKSTIFNSLRFGREFSIEHCNFSTGWKVQFLRNPSFSRTTSPTKLLFRFVLKFKLSDRNKFKTWRRVTGNDWNTSN